MKTLLPESLSRLSLLIWWVLAGAAGFAVGGLAEMQIAPSGGPLVVVYMTVGGTVAGLLQWPALRRHVPGAGWWVPIIIAGGVTVGAAGLAVGVVAGVAVAASAGVDAGMDAGADAAGVAAAILFGMVVGILQWLVPLRRFARSYWWVLASSVGWIVGGLVSGISEGVAGWTILGAVYGTMTGSVLVWLLPRRAGAA